MEVEGGGSVGIWAGGGREEGDRWTEMERERLRSIAFKATKTDRCSCLGVTCVNSMRSACKLSKNTNK